MKQYHIVAAGRAFTDIIASVSPDFLTAHNIPFNGQRELDADHIKRIQAALPIFKLFAGGPSGNTASVVAALGGKAGFFGKVNDDETGRFCLSDFNARGVDFLNYPYSAEAEISPVCLVLETNGGGRSFAYNPGCSDAFVPQDFAQFGFRFATFFLVEAHLLTSPRAGPVIRKAVEQAKGNCRTVINLHGITSWREHQDTGDFVLRNAGIIIGNETEQAAFSDIAATHHPSGIVWVTTKGDKGAEARTDANTYSVPAVVPKHFKGDTGAGDAFAAGFLFSLSENRTIPESLDCAARTATAIIEEESARPKVKTPGSLTRTCKFQNG